MLLRYWYFSHLPVRFCPFESFTEVRYSTLTETWKLQHILRHAHYIAVDRAFHDRTFRRCWRQPRDMMLAFLLAERLITGYYYNFHLSLFMLIIAASAAECRQEHAFDAVFAHFSPFISSSRMSTQRRLIIVADYIGPCDMIVALRYLMTLAAALAAAN